MEGDHSGGGPEERADEVGGQRTTTDLWLWLFVTFPAFAVLFALLQMHGVVLFLGIIGFTMLECGRLPEARWSWSLARLSGCCAVGAVAYLLAGYGVMYGTSIVEWLNHADGLTPEIEVYGVLFDMRFQTGLATMAVLHFAACLTLRCRLRLQFLLALILAALVYPLFGSWTWGGGWLDERGFSDFTGVILVCALPGWSALGITIGLPVSRWSSSEGTASRYFFIRSWFYVGGAFLIWLAMTGLDVFWGIYWTLQGPTTTEMDAVILSVVNTNLAGIGAAIAGAALCWPMFRRWSWHVIVVCGLAGICSSFAGSGDTSNGQALFLGARTGLLVIGGFWILNRVLVKSDLSLILAFAVSGS